MYHLKTTTRPSGVASALATSPAGLALHPPDHTPPSLSLQLVPPSDLVLVFGENAEHAAALKTLSLNGYTALRSDDDFDALLATTPSLTTLSLVGCSGLSDSALAIIAMRLPNTLTSLDLSHTTIPTPAGLRELCAAVDGLAELKMGFSSADDEVLKILGQEAASLTAIAVPHCSNISDEGVLSVTTPDAACALAALDISSCILVSPPVLEHVAAVEAAAANGAERPAFAPVPAADELAAAASAGSSAIAELVGVRSTLDELHTRWADLAESTVLPEPIQVTTALAGTMDAYLDAAETKAAASERAAAEAAKAAAAARAFTDARSVVVAKMEGVCDGGQDALKTALEELEEADALAARDNALEAAAAASAAAEEAAEDRTATLSCAARAALALVEGAEEYHSEQVREASLPSRDEWVAVLRAEEAHADHVTSVLAPATSDAVAALSAAVAAFDKAAAAVETAVDLRRAANEAAVSLAMRLTPQAAAELNVEYAAAAAELQRAHFDTQHIQALLALRHELEGALQTLPELKETMYVLDTELDQNGLAIRGVKRKARRRGRDSPAELAKLEARKAELEAQLAAVQDQAVDVSSLFESTAAMEYFPDVEARAHLPSYLARMASSMAGPSAPELSAGATADDYAPVAGGTLKKTGVQGDMHVYRAIHGPTGTEVVVKTMRTGVAKAANHELLKQMRREAATTSRLDHPSVVKVTRVFEGPDSVSIEMPYYPGGNLRTWVADKNVSIAAGGDRLLLAVWRQLSSALAHAHAAGVVHRDVKPDNVFVADPAVPQVVLGDFGIAKAVESTQTLGATLMTTVGGFGFGTAYYAPPESREAEWSKLEHPYAVDVYSLGVILLEHLTGAHVAQLPLGDPEQISAALDAAVGSHPVLSLLAPVVASMVAVDPATRPTMEMVSAVIESLVPKLDALAASRARTTSRVHALHAQRTARHQVRSGDSSLAPKVWDVVDGSDAAAVLQYVGAADEETLKARVTAIGFDTLDEAVASVCEAIKADPAAFGCVAGANGTLLVDDVDTARALGLLIGKCVVEGVHVPLEFAGVVYTMLAGGPDTAAVEPRLPSRDPTHHLDALRWASWASAWTGETPGAASETYEMLIGVRREALFALHEAMWRVLAMGELAVHAALLTPDDLQLAVLAPTAIDRDGLLAAVSWLEGDAADHDAAVRAKERWTTLVLSLEEVAVQLLVSAVWGVAGFGGCGFEQVTGVFGGAVAGCERGLLTLPHLVDDDAMFGSLVLGALGLMAPATERCVVCGDGFRADEGMACRVATGSAAHFLCRKCFGDRVKASLTPDAIGEFKAAGCMIKCPMAECPAEVFSLNDVSRWAPESFVAFVDLRQEVFQAKLQQEMEARARAELEEALKADAFDRDVHAATLHIQNNILTLRCPRCDAAFATTRDAQRSAATAATPASQCRLNPNGQSYYVTEAQFKAVHRGRQQQAVTAYLGGLDGAVAAKVREMRAQDFADLGIVV
ncbi:serine/threonine protein kinase [Thecamonas trahens ATCC 50062]|uniref:Serine/threonine protein kinase n=1 Tax=Thecamonas trahens ATCC 50062 TaxID=461836 RepID=A0A0L0DQD6_THETB|nr:serine/threonine protein kinase [Thecamonas trahens ATCC 50062]KNC54517.1 serine/threonine protein kinase [Thecamonas trahens ATCC 50062]|eukprot:XP_013753535.1 serine/threonine protein kinase [Thecamonas trahens ATCC 50062]